jgi:hypothetical protein
MTKKKIKRVIYKEDKYLLLDWKKLYVLLILWTVSVMSYNILKNSPYYIDEIFFFLYSLLIPVYFFVSFVYTLYRNIVKAY